MSEPWSDEQETSFTKGKDSGGDSGDREEEDRRQRRMHEAGPSFERPKSSSTPKTHLIGGKRYEKVPSFMEEDEHDGSAEDIEKRLIALKTNTETELPIFPSSGKENELSFEDRAEAIERVKKYLKIQHPNVSERLLGSVRFTTDAKRNPYDIVVVGDKGKEYKVVRDDGKGLMKELYKTAYFRREMGPSADEIARELWKANWKENLEKEEEKDPKTGKKKEKEQFQMGEIRKDGAESEQILQKKADVTSLEQMKDLKRKAQTKNASFREIIQDEEASESQREQARENLEAGELEEAFWENAIQEREDPRLSTRVKAIFRKYGLTITAILSAAGLAVSAVLAALMASAKNASAAAGKAMQQGLEKIGNGLKELGGKLANLLPGLIGAIASFLFKAAASVVGFLAKNTWLLIVAAVWFAYEQLSKKRKQRS